MPNIQTNRIIVMNGMIGKLFLERSGSSIKIEPNLVFRGTVFPVIDQDISKEAEKSFRTFMNVRILSPADLYGSKICAALDRQHPRDLFDINILFQNEGLTDEIRMAFVVYLAGHNRPMHELLGPRLKDVRSLYLSEFSGMTRIDIGYKELEETRKLLISKIAKELTPNERNFLLSIKYGEPEWELMNIKGIDKLPAIQWKLQNIKKMSKEKHKLQFKKLKKILNI